MNTPLNIKAIIERNDVLVKISFNVFKNNRIETSTIDKWISQEILKLYRSLGQDELNDAVERYELYGQYPQGTISNVRIIEKYTLQKLLETQFTQGNK